MDRHAIAASTVFVSHETYTPARGGSASAEINALRSAFGPEAGSVVITNTKGFTGHAMGAGIEDVVAIKALETGIVPPVPNFKEPDPELGELNLSQGGAYPVRYALRLAAGFGSQIAMSLLRWTPMPDGRHRAPSELGYAYRIVDPERLAALAGRRRRPPAPGSRSCSGGCASSTGARPRSGRPPHRRGPSPSGAAATGRAAGSRAPRRSAAGRAPAAPAAAAGHRQLRRPAGSAEPAAAASAPVVAAGSGRRVRRDEVTEAVVSIVAEMTGYPPELLDLDLDLEADLGVDTVKQAEVFAAVRRGSGWSVTTRCAAGLPDAGPRDRLDPGQDRAAGRPPTRRRAGRWCRPSPRWRRSRPRRWRGGCRRSGVDEVTDAVVSIVAEMTGYPPELLDLDLDLEADLGVDTVKQAEVFAAVRQRFGVERDDKLSLRDFPTLTHVIGWIRDKTGHRRTGARRVGRPGSAGRR